MYEDDWDNDHKLYWLKSTLNGMKCFCTMGSLDGGGSVVGIEDGFGFLSNTLELCVSCIEEIRDEINSASVEV